MKTLIVIDMQNDFINGSLGTKEAENIVDYVAEKIKNWEGQIILTEDTHYEGYLEDTIEGRKLPIEHCIYGTKGWEFHPKIIEALKTKNKEDTLIKVITKDTFGFLYLGHYIHPDSEEIEICGLCTDICVISNVLVLQAYLNPSLTDIDIEITVDSKGCAGTTPENHEAALKVMKSCLINII